MATNPQISYAAADAGNNALAPMLNGGKLRIYSGTVPTRADDSIGAAVMLAELTMGATAFGASSNGVIIASAITGANAVASGTATFYRVWDSAGTTCYLQGTIGTSSCDMNMNSNVISAGAEVSVSSFTHTAPRGG